MLSASVHPNKREIHEIISRYTEALGEYASARLEASVHSRPSRANRVEEINLASEKCQKNLEKHG
jgi:hypothetical protein